ncbi:MAG TPA: hypothetical protein DEA82_06185 [Flavobacteriaceae bacterium]|nr:hypothetical protein [Flavobacteriaceae bacterium]MAY54062.1 hypothetical protein [Flavobacteriaceae bacterium]HBR53778.1 hypothetical protein [Flavobacteriaceae bacterium]|tara:strand:- start:6286 stop:6792 length:507 start_codon:yes stop_codon:yes gene_type:complete
MKFLKIAILLALFPLVTASADHKFYVSITNIEYAPKQESLQIITKIFLDDLEAALETRYGKKLKFNSTKETEAAENLLKEYLFQKFKIHVNGTPVSYTYIGKEYDIDVVKCYLEVTNVKKLSTLEIENKVLHDMFDEQQNIIHVKKNKKRRSLVLEKENPKGLLNFSD